MQLRFSSGFKTGWLILCAAAWALVADSAHADGCVPPGSPPRVTAQAPLKADQSVDVPEAASGFRTGMSLARGRFMVVSAHPLATQAGCDMLHAGGNAMDAAVAMQMVLGLVEPQSSGLGGGGFMLHHDAQGRLTSFDGRETAPQAARAQDLQVAVPRADGQADMAAGMRAAFAELRSRGTSVGVPGLVRMLALAHQQHGRLPWAQLMQPAHKLATEGFAISPRLAEAIAQAPVLKRDPEALAYFFNADGSPKTVGTTLRNPAYARTLQALAANADAFYNGDIAQAVVQRVQDPRPGPAGAMTPKDLAQYRALIREPLCSPYRSYWVCGMAPPSAGGLLIAQALGMLAHTEVSHWTPAPGPHAGVPDVRAVHHISEVLRLAFADRNAYVADPALVPQDAHVASLLAPDYLKQRAASIDPMRSMGTARAGGVLAAMAGSGHEGQGTSHLSVVDAQGHAVALTASIESSMGSYRWVRGFLLNHQLTDFNWPAQPDARLANRIEPGKRPRSAMSPTMVFKRRANGSRGELFMTTGSPGGPAIMPYVLKSLVAVLDWGLDAQAATELLNFGAFNTPQTWVEASPALADHPAMNALTDGLKARGHQVSRSPQTSGLGIIIKETQQWTGGADPRRDGMALGDLK